MDLSNRTQLFWLTFCVILLTSLFVILYWSKLDHGYRKGNWAEADDAVAAAVNIFRQHSGDIDLTNGPCLANNLKPDWVVDIVHYPRESVDDLPENQCQSYLEGLAKHFVELDQNGNVVRVK